MSWHTHGNFTLTNGADTLIHIASESELRMVVAQVLLDCHYADLAAQVLGVEPTNEYQNFTYQDWIDDCKQRLFYLKNRD